MQGLGSGQIPGLWMVNVDAAQEQVGPRVLHTTFLYDAVMLWPSESHIVKTISQDLCPSDGRSCHIAADGWRKLLPGFLFLQPTLPARSLPRQYVCIYI